MPENPLEQPDDLSSLEDLDQPVEEPANPAPLAPNPNNPPPQSYGEPVPSQNINPSAEPTDFQGQANQQAGPSGQESRLFRAGNPRFKTSPNPAQAGSSGNMVDGLKKVAPNPHNESRQKEPSKAREDTSQTGGAREDRPQNGGIKETVNDAKAVKDVAEAAAKGAELGGVVGAVALGGIEAIKNKEAVKRTVRRVLWLQAGIMLMIILVGGLISLSIGKALGAQLGPRGNVPTGVAVANEDTYSGLLYNEMQPQLNTTYQGKNVSLFLGGTVGKYSDEVAADSNGVANGNALAFWSEVSQMPGFQPSWINYYITARWPAQAVQFTGTSDNAGSHGFEDTPPYLAYAGRRMIIYNPKTQLGVVGIALEYGPQAFTGASQGSTEYNQQQSLWQTGSHGGWRNTDPEGYIERIAGGPPTLAKALGNITNEDQIYFGFATDQSLTPGTIIHLTEK